jgi:hypothetical protein
MALALKIFLESQSQYKVMKFTQDMNVAEVICEIREKTEIGGSDHGLFRPANEAEGKCPQWLKETKTLQFYELENGVILMRFP